MTVPFKRESNVNFTSRAASGRPSWKRTPWRMRKTHVSWSGFSHFSARPGCISKCASRRTSESKMRFEMRSDCASVPMRGSRLEGEDSMMTTSVLEPCGEAQEKSGRRKNRREKKQLMFDLLISIKEEADSSPLARNDKPMEFMR